MSITAYKIEGVGHDRTGEDYGYVNIMYRYGNKQSCPRPDQCEKMEVMWADESVYGPPAPGSKVGDFIQTWMMGSWDCGVFTHREIAQRLMDAFTGLKLKELEWFETVSYTHLDVYKRQLVDSGDIHCLMIGAAGVGKTANFLYPNIEDVYKRQPAYG